ncbi:hypothetical protein D1AOALGA4SA_9095 [Olavius algarvensis Delta 1 endosymbiont]|nr:hypothetical protein D1AOALGA4SA_9095 [Olavius algarvensis Delta 1 endosymbiont]
MRIFTFMRPLYINLYCLLFAIWSLLFFYLNAQNIWGLT